MRKLIWISLMIFVFLVLSLVLFFNSNESGFIELGYQCADGSWERSPDACPGGILLDSFSCYADADCVATCNENPGCWNAAYLAENPIADCRAIPFHSCSCIDNQCTKVER